MTFASDSARREWQRLRASPRDLAMISWVPALAVGLLWWIFSAGLPQQLPIGVLDQDHSVLSRQLVRFLQATPGLQVAQRPLDAGEAEHSLRRGDVYAVVTIPRDFSQHLKHGQTAQVTLLHNAQFGMHSGLIQRDVRTVVGTLSAGIEMAARKKRGESALAVQVTMEPIRASTLTLFNTTLNYEQFLAAALIPALLHILAMTAGAWAVGRELRDRTMAEWLPPASGSLQVLAALLGKLVWPLLSLGGVGTLALLWLTHGRGWQPPGSLTWVLLALWVFMGLSLALGALAAAVTRSLRTALSATGFVTAPAFAFSGVGFPVVAMPAAAQAWAYALPYTHYVRVQIEQLQMGAPIRYSLSTVAGLGLATVLSLLASAWALQRAARVPATWGQR